jgi:hypothetical protein
MEMSTLVVIATKSIKTNKATGLPMKTTPKRAPLKKTRERKKNGIIVSPNPQLAQDNCTREIKETMSKVFNRHLTILGIIAEKLTEALAKKQMLPFENFRQMLKPGSQKLVRPMVGLDPRPEKPLD